MPLREHTLARPVAEATAPALPSAGSTSLTVGSWSWTLLLATRLSDDSRTPNSGLQIQSALLVAKASRIRACRSSLLPAVAFHDQSDEGLREATALRDTSVRPLVKDQLAPRGALLRVRHARLRRIHRRYNHIATLVHCPLHLADQTRHCVSPRSRT